MTVWQTFLNAQGANFTSDSTNSYLAHFGKPTEELQAAIAQNIITDLSHLGLLELTGEEAKPFLQGQVTNDVLQLNGSNSQFAGYCSPKGRLLALFLAFAHHDHLHLQFNRELLEPIMKRLKMYVLRSKVIIKDVSDEIIRIGFAGSTAQTQLKQLFEQVPEQPHDLVSLSHAVILRLPGILPRFEILTTNEHATDIWNTLSQNSKAVGKPVWDYLEINAGIPDISANTQEAFVPQMINLDALNAINFKKGCYTGQEIVARTHYLGKVKRRTLLAHLQNEAILQAPQAGDSVTGHDGAEAGQIVRVAPAPDDGFDLLVEVRLESKLAGEIKWQDKTLQFSALPYTLND